MKVIQKDDFLTTQWSGGESSQLAIFPENTRVEKRDFDWRMSTAVVSTDESEFTLFNGYKRILIPLNGFLNLQHQTETGILENHLHPHEIALFDGSWKTTSKGKVHDFNLIYKPHLKPVVEVIQFIENTDFLIDEKYSMCFLYEGEVQWNGEHYSAPCFFYDFEPSTERFYISANTLIVFVSI